MARPTVFVARAGELVDGAGDFHDEATLRRVGALVRGLVDRGRLVLPPRSRAAETVLGRVERD